MFKKSVFIVFFVCLMVSCQVASALDWWVDSLQWNGGTDANWSAAGNWSLNTGADIRPPGTTTWAAVLPNQPGPLLGADGWSTKCLILGINAWDPTPWGAQDCNVRIDASAADINCGAAIKINSTTDYDSYLGTTYLASRGILNVYGGTVTTPMPLNSTTLCGVGVGGGGSGYGFSYGMLNIYGGIVDVPRVSINFGEVGLYGGTLRVNTDPNFVLSTDHPLASLNLLKVNGGTFILLGDHTTDINTLRASNHIICERGTLRDPVFDGTWTTLVADINYCVWNPTPLNNATNVHYKVLNDVNSITLSWSASTLYDADVNHNVYFGSVYADVCNATTATAGIFQGTRRDDANDPCSWTIKDPNNFLANTFYYWRVDEIGVDNVVNRGLVWKFKTHDNLAYNPKPVDLATALSQPLQLSWTPGDQAASHRVFFGTNWSAVNAANTSSTDGRYRGTVSSPVYPLTRLLETGANPPGASFILDNGKFYYWRIDEVNNTTTWKGSVWGFSPGLYTNIDDFEDSMSTEDVNANWPDGYAIPRDPAKCGTGDVYVHSGRILTRDSTGKFLQFVYNNGGINAAFGGNAFTEARRTYTGGGASFTGSGVLASLPKVLQIDYRGAANDANVPPETDPQVVDPNADTMYVAIEDTAGNVAIYLNEDHYAQLKVNWTSWYIALADINSLGTPNPVDLKAVSGFSLGFGVRGTNCSPYFDGQDVNNTVMFDNIRLYGSTCVEQYGPTTDMDGDCDVDVNDLDAFSNYWLWAAVPEHSLTSTVPHNAPVIWYKFNESSGVIAADSASGYTGDVCGVGVWEPTGGRNSAGCLNFNSTTSENTRVEVRDPNTAFSFLNTNDGNMSLSVWINANESVGNTMNNSWASFFTVYDDDVDYSERTAFSIPIRWGDQRVWFSSQAGATVYGPVMPANYFGGRWNHWAGIKDADSNLMLVYCNGSLVGSVASTTPLFTLPVQSIRIGMRGGSYANWGKWSGKAQDFQVYDYALSADEVAYLATDGTGIVGFIPLIAPVNFNTDGSTSPDTDDSQVVNFGDLAIMGQQWHTLILWP